MIILVALVGVVWTLFFMLGGEKAAQIIPAAAELTPVVFSTTESAGDATPEEAGQLVIMPLKFSLNVKKEDVSFTEMPDATFAKNEQPWVIFEIRNLASGNTGTEWQTSYDEYIVVIGPDGRTVEDLTGFLRTTTQTAEADKLYDFPVAHQLLTTENYQPGTYQVSIFIDDLVNGMEASQTGTFTIR